MLSSNYNHFKYFYIHISFLIHLIINSWVNFVILCECPFFIFGLTGSLFRNFENIAFFDEHFLNADEKTSIIAAP